MDDTVYLLIFETEVPKWAIESVRLLTWIAQLQYLRGFIVELDWPLHQSEYNAHGEAASKPTTFLLWQSQRHEVHIDFK